MTRKNSANNPSHGADLLGQTLEALIACHAQNVVHCDLKPGNLLVTPEGKVLLADFGISKAGYTDSDGEVPISTNTGPLWGTPQYSPPEAWNGATPTPSWDLYALGVLVHEALTGALPFKAHSHAMLAQEKLSGEAVSILNARTDLSPELSALIDSLRAAEIQDRPSDSEHARELLRCAPESRTGIIDTRPFRHDETTSPIEQSPPIGLSPVTLLPVPANGDGTSKRRFPWHHHFMWFCVLAASILFLQLSAPPIADQPPETALSVVPVHENVGKVQDLFVHRRTAYFSYDDGRLGRELWIADNTGQARLVADINPGKASSNPRHFLPQPGEGFLFAATNPKHGTEPWFCDAWPSHSTRLLLDIVPGPMSSEPEPVAAWKNLFVFYATTLV